MTSVEGSINTFETSTGVVKSGQQTTDAGKTQGNYPDSGIDKYLKRWTQIGLVTLADTDVAESLITTMNPWKLLLTNSVIAAKLENYYRIRGTMEILCQVSFPGAVFGGYNVQVIMQGTEFVNSSQALVINAHDDADRFNASFQDIYGIVNATQSNNAHFTIPFVFDEEAILLPASGSLCNVARLLFWCIEPVQNALDPGNAVSSVLHVYARLKDYELSTPTMQSGLEGPVSGVASQISRGLGSLGNIPIIGPYATAGAFLAEGAAMIASMFGFTRHTDGRALTQVVQRPWSNPAVVDGVDTAQSSSLFVQTSTNMDPTIGGGDNMDPCALDMLYPREQVVGSGYWTAAQTEGTDLISIPVTPSFCRSPAAGEFDLGVAGYCGLPFRYWNGPMHYTIRFFCSTMHRGKVIIYYEPNFAVSGGSNVLLTNANCVLDLDNEMQKTILVPWTQNEPAKLNEVIPLTVADADNTNGRISIQIQNQLKGPGGSGAVIKVRFLITAHTTSEMQFWKPMPTLEQRVQYQAGFGDGTQVNEPEDCYILGGMDGDSKLTVSHGSGEALASIRPMLQRFSYALTFAQGSPAVGFERPAVTQPWLFPPTTSYVGARVIGNTIGTDVEASWTSMFHYISMYVGYRGSIRIKTHAIQPVSAADSTRLDLPPGRLAVGPSNRTRRFADGNDSPLLPYKYLNAGATVGMVWFDQDATRSCEFKVPWYFARKFTCPWILASASATTMQQIVMPYWTCFWPDDLTPRTTNLRTDFWMAFGDDITPIRFRRTPLVKLGALPT